MIPYLSHDNVRAIPGRIFKKVDKQRKFYYNYYTDKKWEEMSQYDLCLDSSAMSEDEILNVLTALYESIL